jgi:hypothetical protein
MPRHQLFYWETEIWIPQIMVRINGLKAFWIPLAYLSFGLLEVISATTYPKAKPTIKVNASRIIRDMLICQKKSLKLTTWVFCTMIIKRRTAMIRITMVLVFIPVS